MSDKNEIKRFTKVPLEVPFEDLNPLNVQCSSTKCEIDLHCFRMTEKQIQIKGREGLCISCEETRVDFERIRKLDISDDKYLIKSLNYELIRKVYWTTPIPQDDINKTLDLGISKLNGKILKRMAVDIGKVNPFNNGITPYTGNVIYYAQHATGTCCRRCMEYWYNFPRNDVALTESQVEFSAALINLYLTKRLPQLFK